MTTDPDYLSDEDCRAMLVAFFGIGPPTSFFDDEIAQIRAAWSARPESARRLDEATLLAATERSWMQTSYDLSEFRGAYLLEGSK